MSEKSLLTTDNLLCCPHKKIIGLGIITFASFTKSFFIFCKNSSLANSNSFLQPKATDYDTTAGKRFTLSSATYFSVDNGVKEGKKKPPSLA